MFAGLRAMLGLDQVVAINVGAAPTPVPVLEFFHAIGLPLAELWGMSETCGGGSVNPPESIKIGTVGPATPGCELKLAEDGELLIRGGLVMLGYRGLPDKTAETIDADGWLHTGDIAQIDDDGYVKIVDRKKEIIINAAGKNMSPANIEATLKSVLAADRQRGLHRRRQALQHGADRARRRLRARVGGAERAGGQVAGGAGRTRTRSARRSRRASTRANAKLARVEQIKKFVIVEGDWLPGGDELTPTMKLKRKPIAEKYDGDDRLTMYSEAA